MAEFRSEGSRASRLDRALHDLLTQSADIEAAAVVSFDGLPMASALPPGFDEDRVAAMSAALLSLGERATVGLGRGELSQVFIEGEAGTVFLVSADNEAVLVAVAAKAAKTGMMLYEVKRTAARVAEVLRAQESEQLAEQFHPEQLPPEQVPAEVGAALAAEAGAQAPSPLDALPPLPSLDPSGNPGSWSYDAPLADGAAAPTSYIGTSDGNGSGSAWS